MTAQRRIAIVGSGNMGGALGTAWARAGHAVAFTYARSANRLAELAAGAGPTARPGEPAEAVWASDVVMLAVPWDAVGDALSAAGPLDGKVLITCVSALRPDFTGQTVGMPTTLDRSAAEHIAALAPGARVVEAFNTTFAEVIGSARDFGATPPTVWHCGDDAAAKEVVAALIRDCGYDALDAGPLTAARTIETLASVWVQTAVVTGRFPNVALSVLRR